jgi:hypothetical protein
LINVRVSSSLAEIQSDIQPTSHTANVEMDYAVSAKSTLTLCLVYVETNLQLTLRLLSYQVSRSLICRSADPRKKCKATIQTTPL